MGRIVCECHSFGEDNEMNSINSRKICQEKNVDGVMLLYLILVLLVDYSICQKITVNPAQSAPRSGFGVDRYFLTDSQ